MIFSSLQKPPLKCAFTSTPLSLRRLQSGCLLGRSTGVVWDRNHAKEAESLSISSPRVRSCTPAASLSCFSRVRQQNNFAFLDTKVNTFPSCHQAACCTYNHGPAEQDQWRSPCREVLSLRGNGLRFRYTRSNCFSQHSLTCHRWLIGRPTKETHYRHDSVNKQRQRP